jgi:UDP-glucoronosyl and UDP-glucosyl transferase
VAAIGPILCEVFDPLDHTYEMFYRTHSKVVYVAFGTHIQILPPDLYKFITAFNELLSAGVIDGIIWAANNTQQKLFDRGRMFPEENLSMGDLLDNLHTSWLFTPFAPQRAILARPETILFVTHGGGSSVSEAIFHGTPMLTLAFFFDQLMNALRLSEAGVALALDKASFSTDEIVAKIRFLLEDKDGTIAQDILRMRHIAVVSARKKDLGADLIEEVMYDHRFSLTLHGKPTSQALRRRPMHLQTADARMSVWRARNFDLMVLGCSGTFLVAGLIYNAYSISTMGGRFMGTTADIISFVRKGIERVMFTH